MKLNGRVLSAILIGGLGASIWVGVAGASGEDKQASPATGNAGQNGQDVDLLKRPQTDKQRRAKLKELASEYRSWLTQDVPYIISDEERDAFLQLSNNEERDQFIEQFWLRRDPTPDTPENEYKEEHYRRIAYANDHFASGIPGWKTDRGRMYITWGPPDEIESHAGGGTYNRSPDEGGGSTTTFPFETWRYRYIEGVGQEVIMEFVDDCQCGQYRYTMNPDDKDALLHTPMGGETLCEQYGACSKGDRVAGITDPTGVYGYNSSSKQFDRLQQWHKLNQAPPIKFKDLEELVTHKIRFNDPLPFDLRADFIKVTSDTVLVPITIQIKNKDITFSNKDGIQRGVVNIFGRVTTMTGRIMQTFEDTVQVDVPNDLLEKKVQQSSVYWKAFPLRAGVYKLTVALKDVNGDRSGSSETRIDAPNFGDDKLASSSMILADILEKVPTTTVGTGNFVIGDRKVRPRMEAANGKPAAFKRDQKLNLWMQVYNLTMDQKTNKPSAVVEYDLVNLQTNKPVMTQSESTDQMGNVGDQLTLEKSMALNTVEPGLYRLTVKVDDKVSNQTLTRSTPFQVE